MRPEAEDALNAGAEHDKEPEVVVRVGQGEEVAVKVDGNHNHRDTRQRRARDGAREVNSEPEVTAFVAR